MRPSRPQQAAVPQERIRLRRPVFAGAIVVAAIAATMLLLWTGTSHPSRSTADPGDVVKASRWAANRGHYTEANRHLSSAMLALAEQQHVDLVAVWDAVTHGGQIRSITIDKTRVRGGDAWVDYTITFADGETEMDTTRLVREGGAWKEAP
jgi:hypothetical protein